MNVIIVPLGNRKVVEVGRDADSTIVRHIDRAIPGPTALTETEVPGIAGVDEFIRKLEAGDDFAASLVWLTNQNL